MTEETKKWKPLSQNEFRTFLGMATGIAILGSILAAGAGTKFIMGVSVSIAFGIFFIVLSLLLWISVIGRAVVDKIIIGIPEE